MEVCAGTVDEIRRKGCVVIPVDGTPVAVFAMDGGFRAVDNRCPHMGFPLSQGTLADGILTCHWHHARFDMESGCTFDLFADDVPAYPVLIREDEVFVLSREVRADAIAHHFRRMAEGMEQVIPLVIVKAVISLVSAGEEPAAIVRAGTLYGARNRDTWASGLTILSAMADILPELSNEDRTIALFQGLLHVARDCAGRTPRRDRQPLETSAVNLETLRRWYRRFAEVRDRDGCERVLRTAIAHDAPESVAEMMAASVTDHPYLDSGHSLDFLNKAWEVLDLTGYENAVDVLPALVQGLASAFRNEESNEWRYPVDLIQLLKASAAALPGRLSSPRRKEWAPAESFMDTLLGDDPAAIVSALDTAFASGAAPVELAKWVAYAAARRIAQFGTSNEYGDWISVLHSFTHANALHALLQRTDSADVARGVYHAAMSVYLNRFLNVPPTRLPAGTQRLDNMESAEVLLSSLDGLFDTQQPVDEAAEVVHRYCRAGYARSALRQTLGRLLLREDAEFHSFQCVEAGFRQAALWTGSPQEEHILVAVARYLAAHSPTERALRQTARIALRLHRNEPLYAES